ncbi:hypothetical protein E6H20_11095 [Candidatus Bathyarchaeota archaeon]|nr:MAG: hypothetical protein E6H20_11095 [Candidatus Bathyarchaeota archaeon]
MESRGKRKLFRYPYVKPLVLIMTGVLFVGAAAAITTLNIPSTIIPSQNAVTTSPCGGTLVLSGGPAPGTGTLRYTCPSSSGAFTVTTVGSDTPTFNPPSEITSVGYVSHSASDCSGSTTLTSGTSTTLSSTGGFDICAGYSCPTGCTIPAWSFSWSS